ncbi:MAG: tyrosine--tRNA ligase [Planctomycetes bacterium]|nr:tyrosine--tRNA ligase [Planctomycetota bacterium]
MKDVDEQLGILTRGCEHVYSVEELRRKLVRSREEGKPLRVKLGMDPTAPDLTLGHTVVLQKLRDFQDLGHKAVLIIGDYTARIGDPTGRSKTRPILTPAEVEANARTYLDQAGKVIELSSDKVEIRHNSEWLRPMNFADVIRLAGQVTVARMLERDTFAKRHKAGVEIYLHEMFYPLMQAHDSVMVESDVELGGTDQTFNNLLGRDFQRNAGQEAQVVVIMPLLVGTDGTEKMSKSTGNYVGVSEPPSDMFGKLMSVPDPLMRHYFELLTRFSTAEIDRLLDEAQTSPRDAKVALAKEIVAKYYDTEVAGEAEGEFFRIHGAGKQGLPDEMPEVAVTASMGAVDLVVHCGFASSKSEARRLMAEGGVRMNGDVLKDLQATVQIESGAVLQRGKRKFVRLKVQG